MADPGCRHANKHLGASRLGRRLLHQLQRLGPFGYRIAAHEYVLSGWKGFVRATYYNLPRNGLFGGARTHGMCGAWLEVAAEFLHRDGSRKDRSAMDVRDQIQDHMPVVCSDGGQFATVDHLDKGNSIKLTRDDQGNHHWIPLDWVTRV